MRLPQRISAARGSGGHRYSRDILQHAVNRHQHRLAVLMARRKRAAAITGDTWCDKRVATADIHADGLVFTAEMYGVQLDQLALALEVPERRAVALVAKWTSSGFADAARLGPGPRWVWLTRAGLARCGLPYTPVAPALSRLAHLRAVTAVRLALTATPQFAGAQAFWRSERRLRARFGRKIGLREHIPDGEVHWPDAVSAGLTGTDVAWAGECWAIEAELTPKTLVKTVTVMREVLARTGDYGCPSADVTVPGRAPRHARVIYLCSSAAWPVVTRARDSIGGLAGRVEIRMLPPDAIYAPHSPPAALRGAR